LTDLGSRVIRGRVGLVLAALAAVAGIAGCGGRAPRERIAGRRLTIYASAPLLGGSREDGQAVVNGARLALERVSSRIGRYQIVLRVLDDATIKADLWDPGQTSTNAHLAAADPTTIGYIGELNSGASAVSIPVLNRAGIAQVSPASSAVGLTSSAAGASPGEPQKYYPTGARTFARLVPNDVIQARVQVKLQRSEGCTKTFVLDDGEVDGLDTATSFEAAAKSAGLHVAGMAPFAAGATDYSALAQGIAASGADCVLISAITDPSVVLVTRQIAAKLPHAQIFGVAGMAESSFTDPSEGGVPLALDPRLVLTVATLDPSAYPPAGRAFLAAYTRRFGDPQPYAIYGYEAMSLMLGAVARATDGGSEPAVRARVVAEIFDTRDRHSVLGTYSIAGDGDTSLQRYGAYHVVDGGLRFWKAVGG
jgi:branched-chain amino acid transport system substrate-binding protein